MPVAYFPSLPYIAKLMSCGHAVLEVKETYPKQTCRNRCEILTAAGRSRLTVPVHKPFGNSTRTEDIRISYKTDWQKRQWRTLESAYRSSPYFTYYEKEISTLFHNQAERLIDHDLAIIRGTMSLLGLETPIRLSERFEHAPILPDLRKTPLLSRLLPPDDQESYPQVFGHKFGFVPGLSILDLLFNIGPDSRAYLQRHHSRIT
jgi:hypothetical protein